MRRFAECCLFGSLLTANIALAQTGPQATPRNVIIFVADGLRAGSVNATVAPTMFAIRQNGVYFSNSHSLFPTFTTPNASAIATGHYLGDTGDFSNTVYAGYPLFNTNIFGLTVGTQTPFLESDQVIADVDAHQKSNYLTEQSLLSIALQNGYSTASIGKVGPVGIQAVTQVRALGPTFVNPLTVIIDDATGTAAGVPISNSVVSDFPAAGLTTVATPRNQPSGTNATAGTTTANIGQQNYFVNSLTQVILPDFKKAGKPFAVVFWSRDPDGTQHNQGDSLNSLTPGINGPTSLASITNADNDLKQIYSFIQNDPTLAGNTDIFVTADHGFATISKHEVDAKGTFTTSYSTKFTYKDATGHQEVNTGFLPAGFLAIDLANALQLPLFDPDSQVTSATGLKTYMPVDPTIAQQTAAVRQRPASGNGLIGGAGAIVNATDASVVIAANGGSDLIYVPTKNVALVQQIVTFLSTQDYVDGLFVDDSIGAIGGTLPMSSINLIGSTSMPTPTIAVNFKTFSLDPANPLQTAVQIADSTLQEGQGMHGTLSRDNTFNNMAAIGPDFKKSYVDNAPISNADIVPTLAQIMGLTLPSVGKLTGRVISEALIGQPDAATPLRLSRPSTAAANGKSTVLVYQQFGPQLYFDQATLSSTSTAAVIANKNITTTSRYLTLDATQSVASDSGPLTYQFSLSQNGGGLGYLQNANTASPTVNFLANGNYTVTLTVTDSRGISSTDTTVINFQGASR